MNFYLFLYKIREKREKPLFWALCGTKEPKKQGVKSYKSGKKYHILAQNSN